MKIIHCADLHLDSALSSNLSREKAKIRNTELCAAFGRLVSYARQEQVAAVLIAGDLFDSPYVSRQTAAYVLDTMKQAAGIRFFYLRGNHDESRSVFADCNLPENVVSFEAHWKHCRCGQVVITAIEPENTGWLTMYDSLRLEETDMNIVMLHGQVGTQPGLEQIALPLLRGKHIRYLALGHLHTYNKASLDASGEYCYAGCLEGRGFDESGEKGFVLLETDGERLQSRFIPFAARTVYEIDVDISGMETVTELLSEMRKASAGIGEENLVKIVLHGTYTLQTQKDIRFLQQMMEQVFWCVKIKDETVLKLDRNSVAYDISLKGEFIRSVLASDHSEAVQAQILSCGICALNGEEVTL